MLPDLLFSLSLAASLVHAGYAPRKGDCPSEALIRDASGGVNPDEAAWVAERFPIASENLKTWLQKTDPTWPTIPIDQYPMIGFVNGGGGLRGWTLSAGVHKAFDADEPDAANYPTAGLYQSFTYETGLSGSAGMLYSYAGNNWPLTSTLLSTIWGKAFDRGISNPPGGILAYPFVGTTVAGKMLAGFRTSLTDTWARVFAYSAFSGASPGISLTLSSFTSLSGYTSFQKPYPIVTAIGVEDLFNACGLPPQNATQYEFTPHEFGSWEKNISSFMQTQYIGTSMKNGVPSGKCVTGYDNAAWVAAVSSNTFNQQCGGKKNGFNSFFSGDDAANLRHNFQQFLGNSQQGNLALMPNPFQGLDAAPKVAKEDTLTLVDGGETIQVPPIWPFLYRPKVDTLIISDNSADSPRNYQPDPNKTQLINFPSGQQVYHTWQQAGNNGIIARMPYIPPPSTFMARNFNKNPMTFFGCTLSPTSPAMFLIYLPNREVVYNSDIQATVKQYDPEVTAGMIANGEAIATNNGDEGFAECIACGLMKRSIERNNATMPAACHACFVQYCSNGY